MKKIKAIDVDARYQLKDWVYLRDLILALPYTQSEIAARMGISVRTLRAYINDRDANSALNHPYLVQVAVEVMTEYEKTRNEK